MMQQDIRQQEITFPRVRVCGIRFQSTNRDFYIFSAAILEGRHYPNEVLTIKGNISNLRNGDEFELTVKESHNKTFGQQFEIISWSKPLPTDEAGILKYLKKTFTGIGEKKASSLIAEFGADVVKVLERADASSLIENRLKWSPKQTEKFLGQWKNAVLPKQIELLLLGAGLSNRQVSRIREDLGEDFAQLITENPYILTTVHGIGFLTADKLALKQGTPRNSPFRIWAGAVYVLEQEALKGHCYTPEAEFIQLCGKTLGIGANEITNALRNHPPADDQPLICDGAGDWWLFKYYRDENVICDYIQQLQAQLPLLPFSNDSADWNRLFQSFQTDSGIKLTLEQEAAVKLAVCNKLSIITGNPGTGKTTILKAILFCFERLGFSDFRLAAPTGKAARRMTDASGMEAETIHRMLKLGKENSHSYMNPLNADLIVVDEMSMVDISLFSFLISSISRNCRLLLVGDQDQLASVGAGRVLQDLLESKLPQVRLTQPQRQAAESLIVRSAHLINRGEFPQMAPFGSPENVWFLPAQSENQAKELLVDLVMKLKTENFLFSRMRVLSPVKKGECGVLGINSLLQNLINPPDPQKQETQWRANILREGDNLIQLRNDYLLDLMNGEEVKVEIIEDAQKAQEKEIMVHLFNEDGRSLSVPLAEMEMQHSYSLTIHKSQGSEYDLTVIFCLDSQLGFYSRKMFYTALTRAKKQAVVIGSASAVARVIGNNREVRRRTKLTDKLLKKDGAGIK